MFEGTYNEPLSHRTMLIDTWRTHSFKKAIFSHVKKGDTVIDFGAGSGIMSMFAALAGAKKVYAIERDDDAAKILKQNVIKNNLQQVIEVFHGDGDKFNINEKVNVIVSEGIGDHLIENKMNYIFYHLGKKFLTEDGILIPQTETFYASAVFIKSMHEENEFFLKQEYGLDLSNMVHNKIPRIKKVYFCDKNIKNNDLKIFDMQKVFVLSQANFDPNITSVKKHLSFHIDKKTPIHGILLTWDSLLGTDASGKEIILHNQPFRDNTITHSWFQDLLLLNKIEESLEKDQLFSLYTKVNLLHDDRNDVDLTIYNIDYHYEIGEKVSHV